jgi:hypothetical protein
MINNDFQWFIKFQLIFNLLSYYKIIFKNELNLLIQMIYLFDISYINTWIKYLIEFN